MASIVELCYPPHAHSRMNVDTVKAEEILELQRRLDELRSLAAAHKLDRVATAIAEAEAEVVRILKRSVN